jgi:hypothetical protein
MQAGFLGNGWDYSRTLSGCNCMHDLANLLTLLQGIDLLFN